MIGPALASLASSAACAVAFAATLPFPPKSVSLRLVRAGLCVALVPLLCLKALAFSSPRSLVAAVIAEAIVGAGLGLAATVVAGAVGAAADLIDAALGSPPFVERAHSSGGPVALLYELAFACVLLQSGGLTTIMCALLEASATLPRAALSPHAIAAIGSASFQAGLRIAGPALFAQALATFASAIFARAAPQLGGVLFAAPLVCVFVLISVAIGSAMLWPQLADVVRQIVSLQGLFS